MPKKGKIGKKGKKKGKKASAPAPPAPELFGPFSEQCRVPTEEELQAAARKGKKGKKKKSAKPPPPIEWAARLQINRNGVGAQVFVPAGSTDQAIDISINCREFDPMIDKQARHLRAASAMLTPHRCTCSLPIV